MRRKEFSSFCPQFFTSTAELRLWFLKHHDTAPELWIGYYKKSSGMIGVTYAEALDQALCFGWIDGIRKSIDELSYANRFTPRTRKSNWSKINQQHAARLISGGLMTPSGLKQIELAKSDGRWSQITKTGSDDIKKNSKKASKN